MDLKEIKQILQRPPSAQQLSIGVITFRPNLLKQTIRQILYSTVNKLFDKNQWDLTKKNLIIQKIQLLFSSIQSCLVQSIYLSKVNEMKILINPMMKIKFNRLQYIYLDNNNIDNIQFIHFIQCHKLCKLSLNKNKISSIKPLNKTYFTNLQNISIKQNQLTNIQFDRLYFNTTRNISINTLIQPDAGMFIKQIVNQNISTTFMKMQNIPLNKHQYIQIIKLNYYSVQINQTNIVQQFNDKFSFYFHNNLVPRSILKRILDNKIAKHSR